MATNRCSLVMSNRSDIVFLYVRSLASSYRTPILQCASFTPSSAARSQSSTALATSFSNRGIRSDISVQGNRLPMDRLSGRMSNRSGRASKLPKNSPCKFSSHSRPETLTASLQAAKAGSRESIRPPPTSCGPSPSAPADSHHPCIPRISWSFVSVLAARCTSHCMNHRVVCVSVSSTAL